MLLGVDVGGTFTDAVLAFDGRLVTAKAPTTPDGTLLGLSDKEARRLADEVSDAAPDAAAVILLHSYRHPEHEHLLAEALRARMPELHVSLSHEVVGTFREFERAATTEID